MWRLGYIPRDVVTLENTRDRCFLIRNGEKIPLKSLRLNVTHGFESTDPAWGWIPQIDTLRIRKEITVEMKEE